MHTLDELYLDFSVHDTIPYEEVYNIRKDVKDLSKLVVRGCRLFSLRKKKRRQVLDEPETILYEPVSCYLHTNPKK